MFEDPCHFDNKCNTDPSPCTNGPWDTKYGIIRCTHFNYKGTKVGYFNGAPGDVGIYGGSVTDTITNYFCCTCPGADPAQSPVPCVSSSAEEGTCVSGTGIIRVDVDMEIWQPYTMSYTTQNVRYNFEYQWFAGRGKCEWNRFVVTGTNPTWNGGHSCSNSQGTASNDEGQLIEYSFGFEGIEDCQGNELFALSSGSFSSGGASC